MDYQQRKELLEDAARAARFVDDGVFDFAQLVAGRLKRAYEARGKKYSDADTLRKLKKELRIFNMTTGVFNDE